jgi:exodeoxyribonuclease-3
VGWRIDYFFVSRDIMPRISSSFIENEVTGSDHCPVGIEMDQSPIDRNENRQP